MRLLCRQHTRGIITADSPLPIAQLLSSNRHGQANSAYREVQARHEDIQRIEQTLTELAQLFNDMAMMIEQQDETIVEAETQAAAVHKDMEDGCALGSTPPSTQPGACS